MDKLKTFLDKIKSEQPIHLIRFYNLIDKLDLSCPRKPEDIQASLMSGQVYLVTFIDKKLLEQLEILADLDSSNRIKASTQNRSHKAKVSGSMIIRRTGLNKPEIVMIQRDGQFDTKEVNTTQALIVENRQNFIDTDKTSQFLEATTNFAMTADTVVIFAEGNQITNSIHKQYLSQFEKIYLCMDFDLGGLRIADNLMKLLSKINIIFLVPDDIESRLDSIIETQNGKYIDNVIKIGLSNQRLSPYAKLMKDKRKVVEQESYLHGE